MPLLDHFHPPLSKQRHWDSFHGAWAEAIAWHLNEEQELVRKTLKPLGRAWDSPDDDDLIRKHT
jgi:hypothetical protein